MPGPRGQTGAVLTPEDLLSLMPFARATGVIIESADPAGVTGTLPWGADRCTGGGLLHGGALMTLADSVGAACAFLNLPRGADTTTVESTTRFFRGVRAGTVRAVARPLHAGRTIIVVQTDLYDSDGRRIAQTTQTQAVLRRDPPAPPPGRTPGPTPARGSGHPRLPRRGGAADTRARPPGPAGQGRHGRDGRAEPATDRRRVPSRDRRDGRMDRS